MMIIGVTNRTHEAIGGAATLAVCVAMHSGAAFATGAFCASLLGSRLPDADQLGARIHRRTRLEQRSLLAALAGGALRLPITIFACFATHRGATHWLLSGAAVTTVVGAAVGAAWVPLGLPVALGIGCGYAAHLLADACTPCGVPLLGPVRTRRVHLLPPGLRVTTGSRADFLLQITATLTAATFGLVVLQAM